MRPRTQAIWLQYLSAQNDLVFLQYYHIII